MYLQFEDKTSPHTKLYKITVMLFCIYSVKILKPTKAFNFRINQFYKNAAASISFLIRLSFLLEPVEENRGKDNRTEEGVHQEGKKEDIWDPRIEFHDESPGIC